MRWGPLLGALAGPPLLVALIVVMTGAPFEAATYGLALAGGALLFVLFSLYRMVQALARPDLEAALSRDLTAAGAGQRQLREEKRRLLRAINELEFDYQMGKLSEPDYKSVREGYELQAIEVLRALDDPTDLDPALKKDLRQRGLTDEPEPEPEPELEPEQEPELAVAGSTMRKSDAPRMQQAASSERPEIPTRAQDRPHEPDPRAQQEHPRSQPEPAAALKTCRSCKAHNDADARFCKRCGANLSVDEDEEKSAS